LFGAAFGFLAIKGEARTIGRLFAYSKAIVLLQYIRQRNITSIFSSHNLTKDCKHIPYAPGFEMISGMLVIPLTLSSSDFLVFFRKTQVILPQHFTQYN
jgi:light-regulated signal transduction histidine kinase (bacteriophytochrome)